MGSPMLPVTSSEGPTQTTPFEAQSLSMLEVTSFHRTKAHSIYSHLCFQQPLQVIKPPKPIFYHLILNMCHTSIYSYI